MHWKPLTSFAIALGLSQYCVSAAHAQSPTPPRGTPRQHLTVHDIRFTLGGDACKQPSSVWVVINDIDIQYEAKKDGVVWKADTLAQTFDAASAHASLRIDGRRTDCRPSVPNWDERIATFKFPQCPPKLVTTIEISTVPGMDVSYVRDFRRQPESVPCPERVAFSSAQPYPVTSLQFPEETLVLLLDRAKPAALGLRIHDLLNLYHGSANSNFPFITPDGIAYAVAVQRAKSMASTPNVSSNAIDLHLRQLHDAKFEKLELKVY
jgi:hypothetical protein